MQSRTLPEATPPQPRQLQLPMQPSRGGRMQMQPPLVAQRGAPNNGYDAHTPISLLSFDEAHELRYERTGTPPSMQGSPENSKYYMHGHGDNASDDGEEGYSFQSTRRKIITGIFYFMLVLASLYVFMVGIKFIETGLTLAFGCDYHGAFDFTNNPVAGLMIGTMATALVHSSSTVTSVTVALVGTGAMNIRQAVPVVMGANVGTCITCIIVAFAQVKDRGQFERAMAAATVHDMYNIWSVIVMFPIEVIFHPLEKLGEALADTQGGSGAFTSPLDTIVNPLTNLVIVLNKKALETAATGGDCSASLLIKGGVFKNSGMSQGAVGAIVAVIGFIVIIASLLSLVRLMARVFLGPTKRVVARALDYNGYLNILVGAALTFWVQSSTLVTSTLTPMAGLGVITLEKVYPLVIGANVGTTGTALLAGLVTGKRESVAIAFVHVFFNLFGILLFYPIPITRKPIFLWANSLASWSAAWPFCAVFFVGTCFIIVPVLGLGLTYMCTSDSTPVVVMGWVLFAVVISVFVALWIWYFESTGRERWSRFLERKRAQRMARERTDTQQTALQTGGFSHDDTIPIV